MAVVLARAVELAHKALAIAPTTAGPYNLPSNNSLNERRFEEAIAYGERAVTLAPNSSALVALLGRTLVYAGRPEEGFSLIQRGIPLSPYTNPNVLRMEGLAYYSMGLYEEAIAAFERARARSPKSPLPPAWPALTYADMGQMEQARAAAQEILKVTSSFSAKALVNATLPYNTKSR